MTQQPEPGREAKVAFDRIHFAKIKAGQEGVYEVFDHFNHLSFTAVISPEEKNFVVFRDLDGDTIISLVKSAEDTFVIRSPWAEGLGDIVLQKGENSGIYGVEMFSPARNSRLDATKSPLIKKSEEFQVTDPLTTDCVGRVNVKVERGKAIVSMQPELDVLQRTRIIATAIILLESYVNTD